MFYVYILQSVNDPEHFYTGFTSDLKLRLSEHNSGQSRQTNRHKPWNIRCYIAFEDKEKAQAFETYLKTHAGRMFQIKHF
ncbi:MAG: GIY-YIG nuclease family protein [Proteobacteria bacterium]|nr:GIY-YIG nuclease family protein [Pseudomonadota bacterium]